jgi:hypothetical protein
MSGDSFEVAVRKTETEYNETGVGQSNRTDTNYELGAVINGAWVRFASVAGTTVDAIVQREQDRAEAESSSSSSSSDASKTTSGAGRR